MSPLNYSFRSLYQQRKIIDRTTEMFIYRRIDSIMCYLNLGPTLQLEKYCAPKRKFIVSELRKTRRLFRVREKAQFFKISVRTFCRDPRICTMREFVTLEKRLNLLNHEREPTWG